MVKGFPATDVMLARINALLAFDIDAKLPKITAPVLVSASADDMLVPVTCSKRLAERLPNATLEITPWGGHGMSVTDPEVFNATLVEFLDQLAEAAYDGSRRLHSDRQQWLADLHHLAAVQADASSSTRRSRSRPTGTASISRSR